MQNNQLSSNQPSNMAVEILEDYSLPKNEENVLKTPFFD